MLWLGLRMLAKTVVLAFVLLFTGTATVGHAQDSEQATRQFAVAVGFQNQKLYDSAIEEWQTFLKKYPQDSRLDKATHYLGTCQLQGKQLEQAVATFEGLITSSPKFEMLDQTLLNLGTARYNLAQRSKKAEDYAKAQASFERLSKDFPKSEFAGRATFYLGESLYHQNKLREAADVYLMMSREFPKEELLPDAWYALGICQESLKQNAEAQKTFADFQVKFPQHALLNEVRMRQAECLFAEQKFADAQTQFALVSAAKNFELADTAMLRQARCLYELNKFEEAAAVYWNVPREFAKTKHYDTAVLAGAKCYYLAGKYAQARSGLENVAKRNVPEAAEASQWIARSLLKEKNAPQALVILDAALEKHAKSPAYPQLVLARIDTLYELPGRRAETVPLYAKFAQKFPQEELASQARYMAALTALDLGDPAAARSNSDEFLKEFPKDKLLPDVQFIAAEARLLLKEFSEAERAYRDYLSANPTHSNAVLAQVRLGLALLLAGKHDEALKNLESASLQIQDPSLKSEAQSIVARCYLGKNELDKAADAFERSLQTLPSRDQTDQTLLLLADVYRRLNRAADGMQKLTQLKRDFPKSPLAEEATFRMGESAYAQSDFDQAARLYTEGVSSWPKGSFAPHAQYGLSWTLFKKGEFVKAIDAVKALGSTFPESEPAGKGLYVQAMAEFQLQQYAAAALSVERFLKTRPAQKELLDAQYLLGLSQAGLQQFSEAAKTYEKLLQTDAQYIDADKVLYELGWAYFELGQQAQSVAAFQKLGAQFPQSPLAVESLFRVGESFYDEGRYSDAAKSYSDTLAAAGNSELGEKAAHKLGWSYFKSDKLNEAADAFSSQLKTWPAGSLAGDAEFLAGECFYKQQQWKPALERYAKVIAAKHPAYHALALYRSGESAAALEDWPASLQFHQQVLKGFPEFELRAEARYGVGWALQQQDQLDDAVVQYEKVTEETETETAAKARFMIGECFFAQKKHQEATKHFLKAAFAYGHKEWSAMAWFEAARCFEVLKDVDQAKNCYQQMIEKFPDHPKVADAKQRLAAL